MGNSYFIYRFSYYVFSDGITLLIKHKKNIIQQYQYVLNNDTDLCTSVPSTITKPIVQNAGAFHLHPKGMLIIIIQVQTKLKPQ